MKSVVKSFLCMCFETSLTMSGKETLSRSPVDKVCSSSYGLGM